MERDRPKCILFAGPVGSSKTPVAYYISWNLNLPIFNNDAIRTEIKEDSLFKDIDGDLQLKVRNERLEKLIKSKLSFICDASIDRTWETVKDKLENEGYEWFIISHDLSLKFLKDLYKAKKYDFDDAKTENWLSEHQDFVKKHGNEINFVITDDTFPERMEKSLEAVKLFLKS